MKKEKALSLLLCLSLCLGLTACSESPDADSSAAPEESVAPSTKLNKPPQPEQILSDVSSYRYTVLPEGIKVTNCEVVKRQSNPESKEDIVYCRLTGPEDQFKYSQYFVRLTYNFYDEGGWILDEMEEDQVDLWGPIGYLGSEGAPIEDGLIPIGPVIDSSNSSTPVVSINNEGIWTYQEKVYDFTGNQLSGLVSGTNANRAFSQEGQLFYLCDLKGNRLSTGYERIRNGGKVLDDTGTVVDHRWWVMREGRVGFLNDAGQEVIPLTYNSDQNWWVRFNNANTTDCVRKICVLHDGGINIAMNVDGQVLLRTSDEISSYRDGFVTKSKTNSGDDYYIGYNANGAQIFSGVYYEVSADDAGFIGVYDWMYNYDFTKWHFYSWDGQSDTVFTDDDSSLYSFTLLPGRKCYGIFFDSAGMTNFIAGYGTQVTPSMIFHECKGYSSVYGEISSAYGAYNCGPHVIDREGNYILPPSEEVPLQYTAIEGGLYLGIDDSDDSNGSAALFDWKGNQRTLFFDGIVAHSENGRYFVVAKDGQYYAMKSPIGVEELQTAPASDIYCRYS